MTFDELTQMFRGCKNFRQHRISLAGLSLSSLMYRVFKFFRKHQTLLAGLISFCVGCNIGAKYPYFQMELEAFKQRHIMKTGFKGFHPVFVYAHSAPLKQAKKTYSQASQDEMILELMKYSVEQNTTSSLEEHFFVDLAANNATWISNTYLLEQNGWEGLCIEPNSIHWYELAAYRKCTIIAAFVGGREENDGEVVDVTFGGLPGFQGIVADDFDNKNNVADAKRNIVSISTVFREAKVPSIIDYFSLDVEGAESFVMREFPWDQYKMRLMTIERPKADLIALLERNGYRKLATITSWGETVWFHELLVSFSVETGHSILRRALHHCKECTIT